MNLGDLQFPVDDYDKLPYRDLIDLRDILQKGLASPFWLAYREIVDGNARNYEKAILAPSAHPSLDTAFATEFMRGQLAAARFLGGHPEDPESGVMTTFLAAVQERIDFLQAQVKPDDESSEDLPSPSPSP